MAAVGGAGAAGGVGAVVPPPVAAVVAAVAAGNVVPARHPHDPASMKMVDFVPATAEFQRAYAYLQRRGVLRDQAPLCQACNRPMTLVANAGFRADGHCWRCPTDKGRKMSLRANSFFSESNLSLSELIGLAYTWALRLSIVTAVDLVGISERHTIQWFSLFREVCSTRLIRDNHQIGGFGHVVQIDESLLVKPKYNRGHRREEQWVFGGYDVDDHEGFLVYVPDRSAATLLPIIQQRIAPQTEIHSDMWQAYNGIPQLPQNYTHLTVNHSRNFVDPRTGTHTNHVEAYWSRMKKKFKSMLGMNEEMLPGHMDEFMWRNRYGRTSEDALENLWAHISQWYPPQ